MSDNSSARKSAVWLAAIFLLGLLLAYTRASEYTTAKSSLLAEQGEQAITTILPADKEAAGWARKGETEHFEKAALYGHIDGGAEIFLQYGFQELEIARYTRTEAGKAAEITLEVYRMESQADAFGIYSVKRAGDEKASVRIPWPNWTSDRQVNFARDTFYVNITGVDTTEKELEDFAVATVAKIAGGPPSVPMLGYLPKKNLISGTERYIRGDLAAQTESPLFAEDFWGFKETARAVSARYSQSEARLVLIHFGRDREPQLEKVKALFQEFLRDVRSANGVLEGRSAEGRYFQFHQAGRRAGVVHSGLDATAGRALLREIMKN